MDRALRPRHARPDRRQSRGRDRSPGRGRATTTPRISLRTARDSSTSARTHRSRNRHWLARSSSREADGSERRRITPWSLGAGDDPDWSPDGTLILFHSHEGGDAQGQLYVIRPDGKGMRQLTHVKDGTWLGSASFSPDGKWIAFAKAGRRWRGRRLRDARGRQRHPAGNAHHALGQRSRLGRCREMRPPWEVSPATRSGPDARRVTTCGVSMGTPHAHSSRGKRSLWYSRVHRGRD